MHDLVLFVVVQSKKFKLALVYLSNFLATLVRHNNADMLLQLTVSIPKYGIPVLTSTSHLPIYTINSIEIL